MTLKSWRRGKPRCRMSTKKTDWGSREKPANIPVLTCHILFRGPKVALPCRPRYLWLKTNVFSRESEGGSEQLSLHTVLLLGIPARLELSALPYPTQSSQAEPWSFYPNLCFASSLSVSVSSRYTLRATSGVLFHFSEWG